MSERMRRILYYENILEFKEMTQGRLLPSEVHNMELCRICLADSGFLQDGVCVMDMDGNLLSVEEMLANCAGVALEANELLPKMLCKECVQQLSTLYFFQLQATRAQQLLKRLLAKLDTTHSGVADATLTGQERETTATSSNEMEACSSDSNITTISCIELKEDMIAGSIKSADEASEIELQPAAEIEAAVSENCSQPAAESVSAFTEDREETGGYLSDEYYLENLQRCESAGIDGNDDVDTKHTAETNDAGFSFSQCTDSEGEKMECESLKKKPHKLKKQLLESLSCALCSKEFTLQRLLVAHVNRLHPNLKAFKCRVCSSMFTHVQSLSRHMRTHKATKRSHVCELCGKAFVRSDDCKRHMRIHTGERPYACDICDKAFKQINELKEHQLTHGQRQLHECDICGARLWSRTGMYIHKKTHAGIKNFGCEKCDKRFVTNGELRSHRNVHMKKGSVGKEL